MTENPLPAERRRRHPAVPARARAAFLEAIEAGWSFTHAATRAGVNKRRFYERLDTDEQFAAEFKAALEAGTHALEDEAHRRAVQGVEEPVYQRGELVGTVQRYSDNLLMFLLKKRDPSYREAHRVDVAGNLEVEHSISSAALERFGENIGRLVQRYEEDSTALAQRPVQRALPPGDGDEGRDA